MAKQYFLPRQDADKQIWLQNFSNKLGTYKVKYNITDDEVADAIASSVYFTYYLDCANQNSAYNKKLTQYKNELRDGIAAGGSPSVIPTPPTLPAAPHEVAPGIFKRMASIAAVIKSKSNYTIADGQDLGIEGAEEADGPDKPAISVRLGDGGHPEIVWKKAGMDALDIYVKRSSGDWLFLATDTVPNYTDTFALPATGESSLWKYKCIYRNDDQQVGNWSDEISITVSGM
ncbi:MAG TPA: hypothetical protein PL045_10015 [Chitinophagaceae bacterium]|nr:hypothetical protein [Chitinophagaceae bacterium]